MHFLNCYEISNSSKLAWEVHIYVLDRTDSQKQSHNDRGEIKNTVWKLRKRFSARCRGFGYVIDLDERTVAVPATWDLPSPIEVDGYRVTRLRTVTTSTREPKDRPIVLGIIREAVKGHFKSNNSEALGFLWQDYNAFCQMPSQSVDAEYLLCRRFSVVPKVLRNNRWVLELVVSTVTLDANTFADYYR